MAEPVREDETLLINLSQKGDVNAFNQLVLKYQQTTYNVVLRMLGDRDTAADVTQDTFIAAFRAIQSFRGNSSFRAWLLRIASNQACDYWRRANRHPQDSLDTIMDEDEPHDAGLLNALVATDQVANPEEFLLNHELQELLQKGIQELPLDQRIAVILCDVQGLSYEEIAEVMGCSKGTVASRLNRGHKALARRLIHLRGEIE